MAATRTENKSITIPMLEIIGEDEAYAYAAALQRLNEIATHADTTSVAFRARVIQQLRAEGLDGKAGGVAGFFGATDAPRTADFVVKPLKAIQADLENAARNAKVFRGLCQSRIFDPIRMAREARNNGTAGLIVR